MTPLGRLAPAGPGLSQIGLAATAYVHPAQPAALLLLVPGLLPLLDLAWET